MKLPAIPATFYQAVESGAVQMLAQFDLADTKRRNEYLGHAAVSQEIDEFTALLAGYGSPVVASCRSGGNHWSALLSTPSVSALEPIVEQFRLEQRVVVGWVAVARRRLLGQHATARRESLSDSRLYRCLRCVYTVVQSVADLESAWKLLFDRLPYELVGVPTYVPAVQGPATIEMVDERRWRCIHYEVEPLACPCCDSTRFDWAETDDIGSPFDRCGRCRQCGADVDFKSSFRVVDGSNGVATHDGVEPTPHSPSQAG